MTQFTTNELELLRRFHLEANGSDSTFENNFVFTHADAGTLGSLIKKGVFEEWEYDKGMMVVALTKLGKSFEI